MNILILQEYNSSPFAETLSALRRPNLSVSETSISTTLKGRELAGYLRMAFWIKNIHFPPNLMIYLPHPEEFSAPRAKEVASAAKRDGSLLFSLFASAMTLENALIIDDICHQYCDKSFTIRGFRPSEHTDFLIQEIIRLSESGQFGSLEIGTSQSGPFLTGASRRKPIR